MQTDKESCTSSKGEKKDQPSVVKQERFGPDNSESHDEALLASQQRFSALFEGMLNGCAYCRILYEKGVAVDFIHEAVNPAFLKQTGLKNLVGMKSSEALPSIHTTTPELLERFARVAESGIAERFEVYIDPLKIWHDISAFSSIKGEFFIVFEDITVRKQAEQKLKASEEQFRRMFEQHTAIQLIIDPESGNILDANPAAAKFYGWSTEELRKMQIGQINILKPEEVKREMESCKLAKKNHFDFQHRRKDGSIRDVEVFSSNIEIAGAAFLFSIIHDVTERKRLKTIAAFRLRLCKMAKTHSVEELLRATLDETEQWTESSFGFCHLLMDDVDAPKRDIWSTNFIKQSRWRTPYKRAHPHLNTSIWSETLQKRKAVVHNNYRELMQQGNTPDEHLALTRTLVFPIMKGKSVIAVMGVGNKPFLYNEEDIRWVSELADIAQNVIDSKLIKIREKKTLDALIQSQKMEIMGQLTGGVVHDFSNMLCVILGYTEMALQDVVPELPLHDDLKAIQNAATRSADLSQQLLAFARNKNVTPKILALNSMVEQMVTLLQRLIGKHITLDWIPESEQGMVKISQVHLDQILANLCINARDAIKKNGRITIKTSQIYLDQADCTKEYSCKKTGKYLMLSVTDNGSGIAKKDLPHIFEPFFTTKGVEKGTGLGLSIVHRIVTQNNGYIECESKAQKGSCFKVYLPCYEGVGESAESGPQPEVPISRLKATILLVEDEPNILLLCREMFEEEGYTVLAAATPNEAIQLTGKHKDEIGLLLSDMVLPEMNGCDLYKKLLPTIPHLKALFMSGYTPEVISSHGLKDKKIAFIQKPFRFKSLSLAVHETLASTTPYNKKANHSNLP